ncbi:MAG: tail fiber protein [Pseudomonadota bacterium]
MTEPFVGQLTMFAGNFAPRGWALADGQLLSVSQNDALFSLYGTIYGGDGRTTFALPDMRGRIPLHEGTGPGLTSRSLGAKGGVEQVTLGVNEMPPHSHGPLTDSRQATDATPAAGQVTADAEITMYTDSAPDTDMAAEGILNAGGTQPHTNMMPFLAVNFIVALTGLFPSQN